MVEISRFGFILALTWIAGSFVSCFSFNEFSELQRRTSQTASYNSSASIRGISIGGWLTTEPYITPTLYEKAFNIASGIDNTSNSAIVDEYTLTKVLGYEKALGLLKEHFSTWITEEDFKQISEDGFNLIRLPIGYWAWKQDNDTNLYIGNITFVDPYVSEGLQLEYLEKALGWAQKYNLNVWIDLHGAPNTQNGFDNSGQRDLYNDLHWLNSNASRQLTVAIWDSLFENYIDQTNNTISIGVEIMNEPLSPRLDEYTMVQYYYKAFEIYKTKQKSKGNNNEFVIHDAFKDIGHWNLYLNPDYSNVTSYYHASLNNVSFDSSEILVDHHHYEVFTDFQLNNNQSSRITDIINYGVSIANELVYHPTVVGEFSAALTDCALWINGVGIGSRYDGSYYKTTNFTTDYEPAGSCQTHTPVSNWTQEYKDHVRQFVEAQLVTYSNYSNGWIFWNWKTENATEWDYTKLKENGLFPSPLNNYTYFQSDGNMQSFFSSSLFPPASSTASTSATSTTKANDAVSVRHAFKLNDNGEKMSLAWKSAVVAIVFGGVAVLNFM